MSANQPALPGFLKEAQADPVRSLFPIFLSAVWAPPGLHRRKQKAARSSGRRAACGRTRRPSRENHFASSIFATVTSRSSPFFSHLPVTLIFLVSLQISPWNFFEVSPTSL